MEKRLLLFMFLSFVLLWFWFGQFGPKPEKPKKDGENGTEAPGEQPDPGPGEPPLEATPAAAGAIVPVDPPLNEEGRPKPLASDRIQWEFSKWGASVEEAKLKEFTRQPGQDLEDPETWYRALTSWSEHTNRKKLARRRRSLTVEVVAADAEPDDPALLRLHEVMWEDVTPKGSKTRIFSINIEDAGVVITKEFSLPEKAEGVEGDPHHLDMALRLQVLDLDKARRYGAGKWRFRLTAVGGLPAEQFQTGSPVVAAVMTTDSVSMEEFDARPLWRRSKDSGDWPDIEVWPEDGEEKTIAWVGLHNRFFGAILRPADTGKLGADRAIFYPTSDWMWSGRPDEYGNWAAALEFDLPLPAAGAAPQERRFEFFVGPMDPDLFSTAAYSEFKPIIDYGLFGFISKAIVFLLGVIYSVVRNWGVAIIIMTIIIRMAMFPLSRKSQLAMQNYSRQMMRLKPKVDQLKERHAKNRKKMNEEMMKLYREEGVRMVPAGCLIMFLQLPIFIGLFQALRYSIGLRHSSFLWAVDLTAPDRLLGPLSTGGIPLVWDPFYLNIFPILMGITWYLSSAMAPKPTDPQQQSTMKMMKWLPIIFSLLLYMYPAGLALYMVVSSTWAIFETKVVKKVFLKTQPETSGVGAAFRKGK